MIGMPIERWLQIAHHLLLSEYAVPTNRKGGPM